jgi:hypothetical protein
MLSAHRRCVKLETDLETDLRVLLRVVVDMNRESLCKF